MYVLLLSCSEEVVLRNVYYRPSDALASRWRPRGGLETECAMRPGITLVGRALARHVAGRGQLGGQLCKSGRASDSEAGGLRQGVSSSKIWSSQQPTLACHQRIGVGLVWETTLPKDCRGLPPSATRQSGPGYRNGVRPSADILLAHTSVGFEVGPVRQNRHPDLTLPVVKCCREGVARVILAQESERSS